MPLKGQHLLRTGGVHPVHAETSRLSLSGLPGRPGNIRAPIPIASALASHSSPWSRLWESSPAIMKTSRTTSVVIAAENAAATSRESTVWTRLSSGSDAPK